MRDRPQLRIVSSEGQPPALPPRRARLESGIWLQASRRYAVYVYWRGKNHYVGSYPTLDEARDARAAKKRDLHGGRPSISRRHLTRHTFGSFFAEVYTQAPPKDLRPSTKRGNASRTKKWILPFWEGIHLIDITYQTCARYRVWLGEQVTSRKHPRALSGKTQRESFCLLRHYLTEAVRAGHLVANPAAEVELPRSRQRRVHVPTAAHADAVVAAITASVPHMLARVLRLTGLRINEALALTWDDLALDAAEASITKTLDQVTGEPHDPKTERGNRAVDLHPDLVRELRCYRAGQEAGAIPRSDPFVFPAAAGSTRPLNDRNFVQRFWDPAIAAVGCTRFTPHALRHLWASHVLQCGAPVAYVSSQLGHESPAFTYKQYVRFIPRSKQEAQGYLQAAFGPPTQ